MNKSNKREDILNSALKLFFKKGFNATSVEEITREAGISKGSFYTYFQSKEELLTEVIRISLEKTSERFLEFLYSKSDNPVEVLESFFDLNLDLAKEYSSNIFTLIREVSFAPVQTRERITSSFGKLVEEHLRSFIYNIKGSCDESDLTILLGTVINFWIRFIFEGSVPPPCELSKKLWFGLGYNKG